MRCRVGGLASVTSALFMNDNARRASIAERISGATPRQQLSDGTHRAKLRALLIDDGDQSNSSIVRCHRAFKKIPGNGSPSATNVVLLDVVIRFFIPKGQSFLNRS